MTRSINLLLMSIYIVLFSPTSSGEGSQQTETLRFVETPKAVVSAKLGDTVTLTCAAKGTPSPDIWWYNQNGNLVDPYSVFSSGMSLRFPSITQADVGAYTCVAKSDEGQISFTSEVIITDFLLVTVATHETDGFKRLLRSTRIYNIPTKVLGLGKAWEGGDMKGPGGGHKVNLLKKALKPFKDDTNKLVMFTDGYDVLVTGSVDEIVDRFHSMDARIVFSAEPNCWPQQALADQYPATESTYKYLNSGGFIGFANDLYELMSSVNIKNNEDDQLYFTKLFLNKALREKLRMRLDNSAVIFQNLFSAENDVKLNLEDKDAFLENTKFKTRPLIIHGNGRSKVYMNSVSNYLAKSWSVQDGCTACNEDKLEFQNDNSPVVLIGIFITQPTPFIYQFLEKISQLSYSKNKLHLFVYNNVEYHTGTVNQFIENHGKNYLSVKRIESEDGIDEAQARALAFELCVKKNCGFFFNVDSVAHLDNVDTLTLLIQRNKGLIGPVLVRPYKAWSNFWGALSPDGFYLRSFDYMDIVNNDKRGVWNIPYITGSYLLNSTLIPSLQNAYKHENLDPDMSFCHTLRNKDIFMFVDNTIDMGHLIDPEFFDTSKVSPDLFQLIYNRWDWEQKYLHPEYAENFNPNKTALQPCPDVYWFPIVSEDFCKELIATVEDFGQWSDGTNHDLRLNGGYENVPTRDIHMNQVGYEASWMQFLKLFVRPLQEHVFTGYFHDPPHSLMNFVVRYQPDEQPSLRPHHDSSTYTINLALNKPNIDYQGGGCHFLRYNCSVVDTRMGWLLMHPGRLTHFHEGLKVTGGTRYIMISFIDP